MRSLTYSSELMRVRVLGSLFLAYTISIAFYSHFVVRLVDDLFWAKIVLASIRCVAVWRYDTKSNTKCTDHALSTNAYPAGYFITLLRSVKI